jgi:hypothetical protein
MEKEEAAAARQQPGKHISAATDSDITIESAMFYIRFAPRIMITSSRK